uniref:LamG-like jellyroll fold domain-containing protein n=1 Tax=Acrobeloides nanus TaxID=290746 RepID=A0A914DVY0_9BILA
MSIGVLADNQTLFNDAVNYFVTGAGNGALSQVAYHIHPGYYGQSQEAGRDQGHNTLEVVLLTVIGQTAWNQGVDLYGLANNRILSIAEETAKGNLVQPGTNGSYYQVPFIPYIYNVWPNVYWDTSFSTSAIGNNRPTWACLYHHYVNVKGLAAPYTGKQMQQQFPEGTQSNWGCCSGSFDQLGYETLTCSLDPIASGNPPSGLSWSLVAGNVSISWWGTANASSYNVIRAPQGGAYVPAANGITDPLTYSEKVPSPGVYYYVAVAQPGNIWSQPLQVNANPQALILYYTFDASSGNSVVDSSGNGNNGVLNGNGTWVSGKINNALRLDGSSGYVSLPGTILQSLSDFTVASWLYLTGWQNNQRWLDFGYGTERCMWFSPTTCDGNSCNGSSTFQITYNGGADNTQLVHTPASLPTNQWVHIAIVRNGNLTQLFVNGNVVNSNNYMYLQPFQLGLGTNNTAQFWIGRSQYSADPRLAGIVDDFRLYQGALTASQISALASMSGK